MLYKITERFHSLQGEGRWVGTPMAFVRLSQCPVGGADGKCVSALGRAFMCDTGRIYHDRMTHKVEHHSYTEVNEMLCARDIRDWVFELGVKHLCITGGEPLIYDLHPLMAEFALTPVMIHIETSGTQKLPQPWPPEQRLWLTVSPKTLWLPEVYLRWANELKLLVDDRTTPEMIFNIIPQQQWDAGWGHRVYLQPIEESSRELTTLNIIHAKELALQLNCRLGVQLHKLLNVR